MKLRTWKRKSVQDIRKAGMQMKAHRMAKTRKIIPLKILPSSSMNSRTDSTSHPIAMIGQPIRQALLDFGLFIVLCVRLYIDACEHHFTTGQE